MRRAAALALAIAAATPAAAQGGQPPAPRPGTFMWNDAAAPQGDVSIVVNRARQVAAVYRGGQLIALTAVSTGRAGHRTPAGEYAILEKAERHRSNVYSNAPMPYMQRLTWDGIAIHGGHNPGHPASHGCIRVPIGFARRLFAVTRLGAHVRIGDDDLPGSWTEVETRILLPAPTWLEQSQEDYVSWGSGLIR